MNSGETSKSSKLAFIVFISVTILASILIAIMRDTTLASSHRWPERWLDALYDQGCGIESGGNSLEAYFALVLGGLNDGHTKPVKRPAPVGVVGLVATRVAVPYPDDLAFA